MAKSSKSTTPPKIGDFSQESTKKAVLNATIQHPLTLYSTAVGCLGVLATVLLGPATIPLAAAIGGLSLGAGSFGVNYLWRRDKYANRYIQKLHKSLEAHKKQLHESVQTELATCSDISGAEQMVEQGLEQFSSIERKFKNLYELLSEKLGTGEITFARYYGTAEQVYLSVLDNLQAIITLLKSVRTIDITYIGKRLTHLQSLAQPSKTDQQEMETLTKRKKVRDDQLEKVDVLLTRNEEAMTDLDQTAAAIAEMKTVKGRANMDMELARKQLEELAKRAHEYSL